MPPLVIPPGSLEWPPNPHFHSLLQMQPCSHQIEQACSTCCLLAFEKTLLLSWLPILYKTGSSCILRAKAFFFSLILCKSLQSIMSYPVVRPLNLQGGQWWVFLITYTIYVPIDMSLIALGVASMDTREEYALISSEQRQQSPFINTHPTWWRFLLAIWSTKSHAHMHFQHHPSQNNTTHRTFSLRFKLVCTYSLSCIFFFSWTAQKKQNPKVYTCSFHFSFPPPITLIFHAISLSILSLYGKQINTNTHPNTQYLLL